MSRIERGSAEPAPAGTLSGTPANDRWFERKLFVTPRVLGTVARTLRTLGIIGATLLLVGPVLIGVGFANSALAENNLVNCTSNCNSAEHDSLNATIDTEVFLGVGLALSGVGAGLVFAAGTQFMARRPP